ncbi:hypothetical protein E4665_01540 [Sporolactobacillus shoreae]|uniref:Uncharacterized protein n=1 Tax=Sporolactobacillus shoreae TaxID=1465501 RepID=A0A4Z0GV16_9BACL|nr:hypothetical protein [Sporolactobacillus shoreae]TGB00387.1 hypothetical protein E4665_01540 [Sporolactobacillus shoreae]
MSEDNKSPMFFSEIAKDLTIAYMEKHPRENIDEYVSAFEHFYEVVNYTAGSTPMMNVYPGEIIRSKKTAK